MYMLMFYGQYKMCKEMRTSFDRSNRVHIFVFAYSPA